MNGSVRFVEFQRDQLDELIVMWRRSFETALDIVDPHPIADQKEYFEERLLGAYDVRVALSGEQVVGFIAASAAAVAQLYIHVDYQGQGIGSQLLDWAKARSDGSLWLYTFERNRRAQRFYEQRGFRVTARGFEEDWQLEDIRYEWSRSNDDTTGTA
ncbi:MAG: GNAT family N-acetyltransferase [Planctomycetota bacterium]